MAAGNAEAMELWLHVQTQWRAGGLGLVGLDYTAVRREARELGLYMSHGMMRKLQSLEHYCLRMQKPKRSNSNESTS